MTKATTLQATPHWWESLFERGRLLVTGPDGRFSMPIGGRGARSEGVTLVLATAPAFGGVRLTVDVETDARAVELNELTLDYRFAPSPLDLIVCNGFQSWTETARLTPQDTIAPMSPGVRAAHASLGDDVLLPYTGTPGEMRSWCYTVVRSDTGVPLFLGSMDEERAYTAFEFRTREGRLRLWRDIAGWSVEPHTKHRILDVWIRFGPEDACLSTWTRERGHSARAEHIRPAIAAWRSGGEGHTPVSEAGVLETLEELSASRLPLDLVHVDAGWQVDVGHWEANDRFPRGLAPLADAIHAKGYAAGVWIAPFVAQEGSQCIEENPEWLLRDASGDRIRAGSDAERHPYWALDLEREDVQAFVHQSVRQLLHEWQFDFVTADYLFAAGLRPRPGRTRAAQMRDALALLRAAAGPDKRLAAGGVPIGPAFGAVDFLRVGPDVTRGWDAPLAKMLGQRERPSTAVSLNNILVRAGLSGRRFLSDPHLLVVGDDNTALTTEERYTLLLCQSVAADMMSFAEDLATFDAGQLRLLHALFPPRRAYGFDIDEQDGRMVVSTTIGGQAFRLYVNFQSKDANVVIHEETVLENDLAPHGSHSFGIRLRHRGDRLCVPGHGARIVAVVPPPLEAGQAPRVMGSDGHVIPGAELVGVRAEPHDDGLHLSVSVHEKAKAAHLAWIEVAPDVETVVVRGKPQATRPVGAYRVAEVKLRPPRWRPSPR